MKLPPNQQKALKGALERRASLTRSIKAGGDPAAVKRARLDLETLDWIFKGFEEYRDA